MNSSAFQHIQSGTARQIEVQNETYLFFSGTDYLGISQNEAFKQLYIEGIQKWGFNNGTSRNNNVQLDIYPQVEKKIAGDNSNSSIVTSSGYLAAQLVVQYYQKEKNILFSPQTHPAIWIQSKPIVPINNFNEWIQSTVDYINHSNEKRFVIISNAVDTSTPQLLEFDLLNSINNDKEIILIIDDSHGIGFTRMEGSGVYPTLPKKKNFTNIVVASMAKGLGIRAGVIISDHVTIQELRKTGMYIGASPPSPASMYAYLKAEDIYKEALANLNSNNDYFKNHVKHRFQTDKSLPIYVSSDELLFEKLKKKNILISSFAYPSVNDPLLNRIIINAAHKKKDLDYLLETLDSL